MRKTQPGRGLGCGGLRRVARLSCDVVTGRARRKAAGLRRSRRPARVESGGLACLGYAAGGEAVRETGALRLGSARAGAMDTLRPGISRPSKRRWGEQRSIPSGRLPLREARIPCGRAVRRARLDPHGHARVRDGTPRFLGGKRWKSLSMQAVSQNNRSDGRGFRSRRPDRSLFLDNC